MKTHIKILALLAALAAPSLALASAGKVLFTLGRVDIQRAGAVIPATRGMPVEPGDLFDLGATGRTQIRMNDGALIALRPGTSFAIEDFQMPDTAAAAVTAPADSVPVSAPAQDAPSSTRSSFNAGGRALFSLLKGGFRTITGLIGKGEQDVYLLRTPAATIGIRGTDYSATYCSANCGSATSGLYVGVSSGKIEVTNNTGTLPLNDNQYGYVQDENAPPEKQLEPPANVLDPPIEDTGEDDDSGDSSDNAPAAGTGSDGDAGDAGSGDSGTDGSDSGDGSNFGDSGTDISKSDSPPPDSDNPPSYDPPPPPPPEVPGAEPDPTTLSTRFVAHSTGPLAGSAEFAGVALNDTNEISVDVGGELLAFRSSTPAGIADYALGTAQTVNQGFDPATDLRWGRWSTGAASVGSGSLDLSSQSLHWIIGPETTDHPVLPITGSTSYSLVGNTDPTDNLGNVGFLGSAQFSACFSCTNSQSDLGTVQSSLDLWINNQVWSASGTGDIISGAPVFAGVYGVSVDSQTGGTGSFAGFFTGPPDGGVPPGAGLAYSLNSGTTTVSGATAFGNPTGGAP